MQKAVSSLPHISSFDTEVVSGSLLKHKTIVTELIDDSSGINLRLSESKHIPFNIN